MKHFKIAVLANLWFAVVFGLVFPFVIWGAAKAFPHQAGGSFVMDASGRVVGSELIGQTFTKPWYFHSRPSAAGNGYDATASGGTNLGPTNDKLLNGVHGRKNDSDNFDGVADLAKAYRQENGLADDVQVPADAATRSASGLDPDISIANALLQARRVATSRKLTRVEVVNLVHRSVEPRFLGTFGEPCVNVLKLNLALDAISPPPTASS